MPRDEEWPHEGVYRHWTLGLDYMALTGGVMCGRYGDDTTTGILRFGDLMHLVGATLVKGWRPLRGHELRFLRTHLDLGQKHLADAIGTTRATVARWEEHWTHLPEKGKESEPLPVDKALPAWGDRAVRLYAAAAMGLAGVDDLARRKGFGRRKAGDYAMSLHFDGARWSLADSTFGPADGVALPDPREGERLVCRLMTGEPYGDPKRKRLIASLEGTTLDAVAQEAARVAAAQNLDRWHLDDYQGYLVAHDDPDVTHRPRTVLRERFRCERLRIR